jgi:protein-S-isoprenylcysteine O-methyltransferase Ste14
MFWGYLIWVISIIFVLWFSFSTNTTEYIQRLPKLRKSNAATMVMLWIVLLFVFFLELPTFNLIWLTPLTWFIIARVPNLTGTLIMIMVLALVYYQK